MSLALACTPLREYAESQDPYAPANLSHADVETESDLDDYDESTYLFQRRKKKVKPQSSDHGMTAEPLALNASADQNSFQSPKQDQVLRKAEPKPAYYQDAYKEKVVEKAVVPQELTDALTKLAQQQEELIKLMEKHNDHSQEPVYAQAPSTSTHTQPHTNTPIYDPQPIAYNEYADRGSTPTKRERVETPKEPENKAKIFAVNVSDTRTVLIDEHVLVEWEDAIEMKNSGYTTNIQLPTWLLKGLEIVTHAPTHEPARSETIVPLYKHLKYGGHLRDINENKMTPTDVVRKIRILVDELKRGELLLRD